jgi:hypothetical protein
LLVLLRLITNYRRNQFTQVILLDTRQKYSMESVIIF